MSTTGHYHRRWSAGTAGRTTPGSSSLTSAIEPSTYGTSWNSVRWNKPSTAAYRSHSSSISSRFDQKPSYSASPASRTNTQSRYGSYSTGISPAARTAANIASMGPSVSARASRFDSTLRDAKDKYRSEARDLINKWTSRERNGADTYYSTRKAETPSSTYNTKPTEYAYRTVSRTPSRTNISSVPSRYSSSRERSTIMSPSPTPTSHTLKAERPWRQRMAESSRIRATHGDDVSASYVATRRDWSRASSRRGSLSQASGDELSTSLGQLRNYLSAGGYGSRQSSRESSVYGPSSRFTSYQTPRDEIKSFKYMSRSYSPVRSPVDVFKNASTTHVPATINAHQNEKNLTRVSSQESLSARDERHATVSAVPKNPTIRESSKERESEKKRKSGKERTARRNSRQRSQNLGSSSSEEEIAKDEAKRKRRKKRTEHSETPSLPPSASSIMNKSMVSSVYDTGQENTGSRLDVRPSIPGASVLSVNLTESEDFISCAGSPREPLSPGMGQKISRSNSKTRLPSKSQIIKSPSLVEVDGIVRVDSKSSITSPKSLKSPTMSISNEQLDEFVFESETNSGLEDESQYSAVAHFKPFKTKVKRIAPVPGVWNKTGGEENISKNKSFVREDAVASTFIVWKVTNKEIIKKKLKIAEKKSPQIAKTTETVKTEDADKSSKKGTESESGKNPIKKLFLLKKKSAKSTSGDSTKDDEKSAISKEPVEEKTVTVNKELKGKMLTENVNKTWKEARSLAHSHPKKIKASRSVDSSCRKVLARKGRSLAVQKSISQKGKVLASLKHRCSASTSHSVNNESTFVAKAVQGGAQVIVDTPQKGVNLTSARLRVKAHRHSMPCIPDVKESIDRNSLTSEQTSLATLSKENGRRSISQDSQSRAAEVLDELRGTEPALEWKRDDHDVVLILPDKSILEEYVKRKRGKLERLHSEPIREKDELSGCNSPCNSTTSELLPACSARVYEPTARVLPVITVPSRSQSVDSSTPTHMLDSIQTSYNNFNSTPQAFFRANAAKAQCAKPIQFEAPRSAFEERLQLQANAIRKTSTTSNNSEAESAQETSGRRGSDGMSSISTSFTTAMAEKQGQNRHERYAAHIPVNRGDGSGRQSAASVDSSQSGVLDTASKQLDQVIDKARHRHHQHRSKFKEAIDYLDQIFEDLKKECDVNDEDNNNPSTSVATGRPSSQNNEPSDCMRKSGVSQTSNQSSLKTNSLPNRTQKHNKHHQPPSPVEVVIPPTAPPEVAVTETFVLPKKTDKLDFTRRWLQDDLSSLAHQPPAPVMMVPEMSMYNDVDEHSLGSCSAEVAAINSTKREKQKKSSKPQVVPQPVPIRPQPYRPQPLHTNHESNGTRHFPVELEAPQIQRVASFDQMPERKDSQTSNHWRSGSQEPYQTLSSVRSDADSRPSPSAFHNVNNVFSQRGGMRGSLRSLPDASMVRGRYNQQVKDPSIAIDQLVAELELNTDKQMPTADKRRSFPTSLRSENESKERRRERMPTTNRSSHGRPTNVNNGYPGSNSYSQPKPAKSSLQHHQNSLDEVASMLNSVVNDFGASQSRKNSKKPYDPAFSGNALYATPHSLNQSNPFETINQEKINPSRVEAMHNMFERGNSKPKPTASNNVWRQQPAQPFKPPKEEESYYDTAEFSVRPYKRVSPPRQVHTAVVRPNVNSSQEYIPAFPSTQPPQHPPAGRHGSANSSTNGGYYSSNSSTVGQAYTQNQPVARRSSLIGRQSLSSRAQSIEDEDDGFYDNIGAYEDRRYSRGSELDVASLSSRQLPPTQKTNKIGSFLRKIGGSRPPGSAASLISLNKVANETPIKAGVLMKSNSLSNEPWRKEIFEQSMPREATPSKGGIGTRLKNSLFGSKKRLNA